MSKALPLSNEKRTENYTKQNKGKELSFAQKRAIRKAERRKLKEKAVAEQG